MISLHIFQILAYRVYRENRDGKNLLADNVRWFSFEIQNRVITVQCISKKITGKIIRIQYVKIKFKQCRIFFHIETQRWPFR